MLLEEPPEPITQEPLTLCPLARVKALLGSLESERDVVVGSIGTRTRREADVGRNFRANSKHFQVRTKEARPRPAPGPERSQTGEATLRDEIVEQRRGDVVDGCR